MRSSYYRSIGSLHFDVRINCKQFLPSKYWVDSKPVRIIRFVCQFGFRIQCRRGPKVGPAPAQIWRISGFVKSKTDGENAAVWSEKWCDLQKKKVFTEIQTVFPVEIRWSPKKKKGLQTSHAGLSVSFQWSPLELMGPLKQTVFMPLKSMGPLSLSGVIVSPCPPSRRPSSDASGFGILKCPSLMWMG